jgi:chromosome segregation ATPase
MANDDELRALRRAYRERFRRDAEAHRAMADRLGEAGEDRRRERQEMEGRITDLEAQNTDLRSEIRRKNEELDRLLNTKTFRYTAAVRRFYGRFRGAP